MNEDKRILKWSAIINKVYSPVQGLFGLVSLTSALEV